MYITATLPYLILTALLIRGVTLPGSGRWNPVLHHSGLQSSVRSPGHQRSASLETPRRVVVTMLGKETYMRTTSMQPTPGFCQWGVSSTFACNMLVTNGFV